LPVSKEVTWLDTAGQTLAAEQSRSSMVCFWGYGHRWVHVFQSETNFCAAKRTDRNAPLCSVGCTLCWTSYTSTRRSSITSYNSRCGAGEVDMNLSTSLPNSEEWGCGVGGMRHHPEP